MNKIIIIHPAQSLRKLIEKSDMTQQEVALRLNMSEKHLSEILNEKKGITPETALKLEQVFGGKASFWINLQSKYDEFIARNKTEEIIEEQIPFLEKFKICYKDLVALEYCKKTSDKKEKVLELLNFFGVTSLSAVRPVSEVAFRKSSKYRVSDECVAAWLRVGEKKAIDINAADFNLEKLKNNIEKIRSITKESTNTFGEKLIEIGKDCGVKFIFVTHFSHAPVNGATRWIDGYPVIQLSDMRKNFDTIIFTLFHELGHVILHQGESFLDETVGDASTNKKEKEADDFAQKTLIPEHFGFKEKLPLLAKNQLEVLRFSKEVGIDQSVIVGRIQRELNNYKIHRHLLRSVIIK